MLVLSRYRDESIYIGDDVIITVVDIRGDRVRLGIQAPPNVAVHRQEVYDAIKTEGSGVASGVASGTRRAAQDEPKQSASVKLPVKIPTTLKQVLEQRKNPKPLPVEITPPFGVGGEFAEILGR